MKGKVAKSSIACGRCELPSQVVKIYFISDCHLLALHKNGRLRTYMQTSVGLEAVKRNFINTCLKAMSSESFIFPGLVCI